MSEQDSYEHKCKLLEEEWKVHMSCYQRFDAVLRRYYHLEDAHAKQLMLLIPELDSIGLYRPITSKLAGFLDTTVFQTQHLLEDLRELLSNYNKNFTETEGRFAELIKEFKRRKQETTDHLQQLAKLLQKKAQPPKLSLDSYNYSLQKYREINETMLAQRSPFHAKLLGLANDEVIRFFVLQLERLRNNQFDIDQILKKGGPEELKLVELEPTVQWRMLEGGELSLGVADQLTLETLGSLVGEFFGEGQLPRDHLLRGIFNDQTFEESVSQLRPLLESNEFELQLRKFLLSCSSRPISLNAASFGRVLLFTTILFQYAVENMKVELLDAVLAFASTVGMRHPVCAERFARLFECSAVFDELRKHQYQREEYWAGVYQQLNQNFEGDEREDRLEKYRRCLRKLGVSMLDQIKPKKRIFAKIGPKPQ